MLLYLTTQIADSRGAKTAAPFGSPETTGPGKRAALPLVPLSTLPPQLCSRKSGLVRLCDPDSYEVVPLQIDVLEEL